MPTKPQDPEPATPDPYSTRLKALLQILRQEGMDGYLVTQAEDIRYLTGYHGQDCNVLLAVDDEDVYMVTDFRYQEEIQPWSAWATIVIRTQSMAEEIARLISDLGLQNVGIQADALTVQSRKDYARHAGAKRFKDTSGLLLKQRSVKDEAEVALIRKAIRIQQEALQATLAALEVGQTEAEVAARLEFEMKRRGADGPAFQPIVGAKTNGSKPHYTPSPKVKVARGQALLIDWGARFDGYCSDMTRTFVVGKPPKDFEEVYRIVLEAQLAAIEAIRPGARLREVDSVARDLIAQAGYGDHFGHSLGHGIGLNVHEQPTLSQRADKDAVLEPGHIVTVEPGIYLPGRFGVRIEDDVLVTPNGRRVLCNYPKDLASARLLS